MRRRDDGDDYLAVYNARLLWVRFVERNRNDVARPDSCRPPAWLARGTEPATTSVLFADTPCRSRGLQRRAPQAR